MRSNMKYVKIIIRFGYQQALSCIFPIAVFFILAVSKLIAIPFLPRYDFILIVCIIVQLLLYHFKLETLDELKVISMFHIVGLVLEIFKVHVGSWTYPEQAVLKFLGVPLYSGFMYASVASYICQAWRRLDLEFTDWPDNYTTYTIACLIYLNFFTHHILPDIRWIIILVLFILFGKTKVFFKIDQQRYDMQVILSFLLIGSFIWLAENIATFLGAWQYPDQIQGWHMVHLGKISSWYLLVIISIIIVANLKHLKYGYSDRTSGANSPGKFRGEWNLIQIVAPLRKR